MKPPSRSLSTSEQITNTKVKFKALTELKFFRPAAGAGLAVLCGLVLWGTPLGEAWQDLSYDCLFGFGARTVTNKVVLIQMDNAACLKLGQTRNNWDRALHARLLDHLTAGKCPLVVLDVFLRKQREAEADAALAAAIRRHGRVVLMDKVTDPHHPLSEAAQVIPPQKLFADAADALGIGQTDAEGVQAARRHYPFPASGEDMFQSLPRVAARLAGAQLSDNPQEQWLRYYGENGAWETFSYHMALSNSPAYFRDKIVFIGNKPEHDAPNIYEDDKFRTPYTLWNGKAVGGMEIMATTFLNLMNNQWLRRPAWWLEMMFVSAIGVLLGAGLCLMRPLPAGVAAIAAVLGATFGGILLSYYTNWWFPWLVVAGGQVPCALAWGLISTRLRKPVAQERPSSARDLAWALSPQDAFVDDQATVSSHGAPGSAQSGVVLRQAQPELGRPDAPEYELFDPPFGEGSFGKVWLVRNAIGQWQALKAVYQANFGQKTAPYDAEFKGIKRYKPVSDKHPGLLRVDFVTRKKREGYFYYVMELGDSQVSGWEMRPEAYKPRDLASLLAQTQRHRLPIEECLRIGLALADALDFLHRQGLTHRDIKPSNIIFVGGLPKLADVGLVTEILPGGEVTSWGGTPNYMPPPPEPPGTVQADIYALGKVLYVISTGQEPQQFPELPAALSENCEKGFSSWIPIILKACQTERSQRYQAAAELLEALEQARNDLK